MMAALTVLIVCAIFGVAAVIVEGLACWAGLTQGI